MTVLARIDDRPLDLLFHVEHVSSARAGAVATFVGLVRDHDPSVEGKVVALEYSAHPDAERFLAEVCRSVAVSSGLFVAAAHRIGSLVVGDVALVAAVAAPHRAEAFATCALLVDRIKAEVPIWKRQHLADGATEWVGL